MRLITLLALTLFSSLTSLAQNDTVRFAIAGHGYGAHAGSNQGLHTPFLNALDRVPNRHEFLILTGDIVRNSLPNSWAAVETELSSRNIESYYVRGNHDRGQPADTVFAVKHGDNYYSFSSDSVLFIALNSGQYNANVAPAEIDFLNTTLQNLASQAKHIVVMFHFLLWNGDIKYKDISSNLGSQYSYLKSTANYWDDIHPILNSYVNHDIYVVAGDLGGRSFSIPAYYEDLGHVKLIASGMGEINDENYLEWTLVNGNMQIDVIPLDSTLQTKPIEDYEYFGGNSIAEFQKTNNFLRPIGNNQFQITLTETSQLNVASLNGQQVSQQVIEPSGILNLNNLSSGIYLVSTVQGYHSSTQKVHIQ